MQATDPIREHRQATQRLAKSLNKNKIYLWLISEGYFPESYVLPPCFTVAKFPTRSKVYYPVTQNGKRYMVPRSEWVKVHFPKSELTDRTFGIIHPELHNDIAYHISRNWALIVKSLFPADGVVSSYSFPVPIDAKNPGRLGYLRSGRMIYEFIGMIDDDIASVAYRYTHIVKTDIKNFYPSIYTHSIAWALHGKRFIRKPANLHNYKLVGNRLDRLFQNANDGCTNGVPIGPAVSDLMAEIIAAAVDRILSRSLTKDQIDCQVIRFKDDYRILVKSPEDGKAVIKRLQAALKEYNLELSDEKTTLSELPDGLFREWVSLYHAVQPRKIKHYTWKQFRELYLAVIRIDRDCPGTGVIDRFLADIVSKGGRLKVSVEQFNLQKVFSMLLMLASRRIKAFPKIVAIIESILRSPFGAIHKNEIVLYLDKYLRNLSADEQRNKYLISWICYFLVSNGLFKKLSFRPKYKDPITRSIISNRGAIFKQCFDHKIFVGCRASRSRVSMLEHLDVFNPPLHV